MARKFVSEAVISRLFIYLRELSELTKVNINTISSAELGERANLNDALVRKDLGYFGQFGVSGSGYNTRELRRALEKILGKDKIWNVAVAGCGHLGMALLAYPGFKEHGLKLVAAFDSDPEKIGKRIEGISVRPIGQMSKIIAGKDVSIGIVAVPQKAAQDVAVKLVESGIKCILNFAPVSLDVPDDVKVKDVDLSRELETLSYFLANPR